MSIYFLKRKGFDTMDKEKRGTFIIISILVTSYVLFFVFQISNEFATLNSVFEYNKQSQKQVTKVIAGAINAKFTQVEGMLRHVQDANDLDLAVQTANPQSIAALGRTNESLRLMSNEMNALALIDERGRVVASVGPVAQFQTGDIIPSSWISNAKESGPVFLGQGKTANVLSFASPILDEKGNFAGMIIISVPSILLQSDFSVTDSTPYSYVAIVDRQLNFLASSEQDLVDSSIVQDTGEIQGDINPTVALQSILDGNAKQTDNNIVYRNDEGEFLITAQPVTFYGKPYLVIVKSDTASFYSSIENVLYQNRIQMFSILAANGVLTVVIASFVSRNISLDKQVKEKTKELSESNARVSEQKLQLEKANEELKRLDQLKTEFLGIASHELKTPITPILLYAEMAKYGDVDKDVAIDVILGQAMILKQLSQDILEVSRIDSKNLKPDKRETRIVDLLNNSISSQKGKLRPDVTITLDADENTIVRVDPLRITQVVNNILDNAAKLTKEGTITVKKRTVVVQEGSEAKSMVEISIKDNGPGIPAELFPKLFGKFITEDINGMNLQGTGLGLYICKGIIEIHGGRIWAQNNADGKGATFTFTLPIA
ncbi:MAG: sensor histidine kinase [Nitrososphaera sp.]